MVCPADHQPLTSCGDGLACGNGHCFEVRQGIPRIVTTPSGYADAFGEQWNRYRVTQLDSYTGTTISRDRLRRCLGEALWAQLAGPGAMTVLETGCGAGRFTEILAALPAAVITSTDLSAAVDANQANCPQSERHRVIQCDINALPFLPGSYDVVVCLGVIQHTPDPEATLASLFAQVKPGGLLVIDHYTRSLAHYTKVPVWLVRPVLKRLPPPQGTAATERLVKLFFPLHRLAKRSPVMQALVSRISPLLTYYRVFPDLDDQLQYEWALLDTHDALTDFYKHFRTCAQIEARLADLGGQEIWVAKGGNGVEARCRKSAAA